MKKRQIYDVIIIGAGPAGLVAGYYLSRFLRKVIIIHHNKSRAGYIPKTFNIPAFLHGISGKAFLKLLTNQYKKYKNPILKQKVLRITKHQNGFSVSCADKQKIDARTVILATGAMDLWPNIKGIESVEKLGCVRQCPVCDAYEHKNKKIAIIGSGIQAINEARFLAHFSNDITIYFNEPIPQHLISKLRKLKTIKADLSPINKIKQVKPQKLFKLTTNTTVDTYDVIYAALGCQINSELAAPLGICVDNKGKIVVNRHNETNIKGIYAIGDVIVGLDQISTAAGDAANAATDIHNKLLKSDLP